MNDVTIALESFGGFIEEAKPLLDMHWRELALYQSDITLAPDVEFYKRVSFGGGLKLWAVRAASDNHLVGYAIYFVKNHPHYTNAKWAISDLFWLHPDYRGHGLGKKMFETIERDLAGLGVNVMHTTLKAHQPAAKFLLEEMGHNLIEFGLSKKLS